MKQLENAPVIKTQLVAYSFDVRVPAEAAEHAALREKLKGYGYRCFNVIATPGGKSCVTGDIELECTTVFNNQWNTTETSPTNPNFRVFDWYEGININNRSLKAGHYLVPVPEMAELRANVDKCGYCGAHYWKSEGKHFCDKCLASPYLGEKDLHLLRLQTVMQEDRAPITDDERAYLVPVWVEHQSKRVYDDARKRRAKLLEDYDKAIRKATTERDGFLWLMDRGVNTENVIYYGHTETFSFGWRTPIAPEVKERLLPLLEGFPFTYEFASKK